MGAEISHQTDADGDLVEGFAGQMATLFLAKPAWADFNLAVARVASVSNDEMVGEAVFHPARLPVEIIKNLRITAGRSTVVNHNIFPLPQAVFGGVNLVAGRSDKGLGGDLGRWGMRWTGGRTRFFGDRLGRWGGRWGGGDTQQRTSFELISAQAVPLAQITDRDSLLAGNLGQSVSAFDSHPLGFLGGSGGFLWAGGGRGGAG